MAGSIPGLRSGDRHDIGRAGGSFFSKAGIKKKSRVRLAIFLQGAIDGFKRDIEVAR
jgi:hypothetical protein